MDYQRGDPGARTILDSIWAGTRTGSYSPMVASEVWRGIRSRREELAVLGMFAQLECADLRCEDSVEAWRLLARRSPEEWEGLLVDALLAATAMRRGERVVTRNVRHFRLLGADYLSY